MSIDTRPAQRRRFPQLAEDASQVPEGLAPRQGVEYGCGNPDCRHYYEPDVEPTAEDHYQQELSHAQDAGREDR